MFSKILLQCLALVSVLSLVSACSHKVAQDKDDDSEISKVADTDSIDEGLDSDKADDSNKISAIEPSKPSEETSKEVTPQEQAPAQVAPITSEPTTPAEEKPQASSNTLIAPVAASEGSGNIETYTVKSGDTLMKISWALYGDVGKWRKLKELNNLKSQNVRPGTKLKYEATGERMPAEESGTPYLIAKGDTLGIISTKVYGTPKNWRKIHKKNSRLIKNPNLIFAGFTIFYEKAMDKIGAAETPNETPIPESEPVAPAKKEVALVEPAPIPSAKEELLIIDKDDSIIKKKPKAIKIAKNTKKEGPKPASIDSSMEETHTLIEKVPEAAMPEGGVSVVPKAGEVRVDSGSMPGMMMMPPH